MALTHGRPPSDQDWRALLDRANRPGVYGVTSTGIYCSFGCPARAPLRKNMQVFNGASEAEAAGFRACLRCGGGPAQSA